MALGCRPPVALQHDQVLLVVRPWTSSGALTCTWPWPTLWHRLLIARPMPSAEAARALQAAASVTLTASGQMSTVRMPATMMTTRMEAATLAATSWGLQARMTAAKATLLGPPRRSAHLPVFAIPTSGFVTRLDTKTRKGSRLCRRLPPTTPPTSPTRSPARATHPWPPVLDTSPRARH